MIKLDDKTRLAMELLAFTGGGFDPTRVTTAALRPILRRRQNDVLALINEWKSGLGAQSGASPNSRPFTAQRLIGASDPTVDSFATATKARLDQTDKAMPFVADIPKIVTRYHHPRDPEVAIDPHKCASGTPMVDNSTHKLAMLLDILERQPLPVAGLPTRGRQEPFELPVEAKDFPSPRKQDAQHPSKDSVSNADAAMAGSVNSLEMTCEAGLNNQFKPPHILKAEARANRLLAFSNFAIQYLRTVGRPAGAREIYDASKTQGLALDFVRASSISMLIDANHDGLCRLENGLFWLSRAAIPATIPPNGYHSRRLKQRSDVTPNGASTKPLSIQKQEARAEKLAVFADFAVMFLAKTNRPAGAAEIFDSAKAVGKAAFARQSARDILSSVNDPRLRKLPDGNYWLTDRTDVPELRSERYFPRLRKKGYESLGEELVAILTACGCAMTASELIVRLSPRTREILPSHHASAAFKQAAQSSPQLVKQGYGFWFLKGSVEIRPRHLPLDDEFAITAMEIVRLRGPSTADEIFSNLPAHLSRLFPDAGAALRAAACSFKFLNLDNGKWVVPTNAIILMRAGPR